ncbi:MAG: hypothetical protein J2P24_15950, partial [Streptosporangiales bacterium]|nr:hypothetical protein [Streptosporangiales bacterium]
MYVKCALPPGVPITRTPSPHVFGNVNVNDLFGPADRVVRVRGVDSRVGYVDPPELLPDLDSEIAAEPASVTEHLTRRVDDPVDVVRPRPREAPPVERLVLLVEAVLAVGWVTVVVERAVTEVRALLDGGDARAGAREVDLRVGGVRRL